MQAHTQSAGHLQDGGEIGAAFAGQCAVKTLARQARRARNLAHTLSARDVAERLGDERGIAVAFVDAGVEIGGHFFSRPKMLGDIKCIEFDQWLLQLLNFHELSLVDVFFLN